MNADDILNSPIRPESEVPKHEFYYDWETTTYVCRNCGMHIGDYQFDSKPCPK